MHLYSFNQYLGLEELNERYSNLANILRGGRKSVFAIGILSAENPHGRALSDSENRQRTAELRKVLKEGRLGYRPVKGRYGNLENSFIVNNISRDDVMALGKRFKQDSVVWGQRVEEGDYYGMDFELIGTDLHNWNEVMGTSRVMIGRENAADFYTEYKGRRFIIPFFGTEDLESLLDGWEKTTFRDYSDTAWQGGEARPSSTRYEWKNYTLGAKFSEDNWKEFQRLVKLASQTAGSVSWNYRSRLQQLIQQNPIDA